MFHSSRPIFLHLILALFEVDPWGGNLRLDADLLDMGCALSAFGPPMAQWLLSHHAMAPFTILQRD